MPTKKNSEFIQCRYFGWTMSRRENIWRADGRSNEINAGRHSLGTRDKAKARQVIYDLDEAMAMKLGLIERKAPTIKSGLTIVNAISKFREHKGRPVSVKGVEPQTLERYNRILNKLESFAKKKHIRFVTEINQNVFDGYVSMLEEMNFARSTIVTEMVLLRSLVLFCIDQKLLDPKFGFKYPLTRNTESLTYCPSNDEVAEILKACEAKPELVWLFRVVSVLSLIHI